MKSKLTFVGSLAVVLLLFLAVGLTQAQGPEPPGEGMQPQGEVSAQAAVSARIPIQGRLTDASGNPVPNGNYSITASIYNVSSGGTALCSDTETVSVSNGLFNMYIDNCTSAILNGQQLYLGIKVGSDAEMTPRKAIYPVPYAFSLKPGAVISDTRDGILTVQSSGTGDADALIANAGDDGEAVTAYSPNGVGLWASSDTFLAVQGYSRNSSTNPAIFGCVADSSTTCDPYRDDNAAGVMGYSARDYGGYFVSGTSADGGVAGVNTGSGIGVYGESATGVAIRAAGTGVIQSTARSYLWISGNALQKANSADTTVFEYDLYGGYQVGGGSDWANRKTVLIPVTIPGQLYGQNITVTGLDLYYKTSDDVTGITVSAMRRQNGVGEGDLIFRDDSWYTCPPPSQCIKHWDLTQNNVLSDERGILYIAFQLGFGGETARVHIGGVRLTLEHD